MVAIVIYGANSCYLWRPILLFMAAMFQYGEIGYLWRQWLIIAIIVIYGEMIIYGINSYLWQTCPSSSIILIIMSTSSCYNRQSFVRFAAAPRPDGFGGDCYQHCIAERRWPCARCCWMRRRHGRSSVPGPASAAGAGESRRRPRAEFGLVSAGRLWRNSTCHQCGSSEGRSLCNAEELDDEG